jgi:hypothetical protein
MTAVNDRLPHTDRTATLSYEHKSGLGPQMGLDTKTD